MRRINLHCILQLNLNNSAIIILKQISLEKVDICEIEHSGFDEFTCGRNYVFQFNFRGQLFALRALTIPILSSRSLENVKIQWCDPSSCSVLLPAQLKASNDREDAWTMPKLSHSSTQIHFVNERRRALYQSELVDFRMISEKFSYTFNWRRRV